jgi:hypothetical protein
MSFNLVKSVGFIEYKAASEKTDTPVKWDWEQSPFIHEKQQQILLFSPKSCLHEAFLFSNEPVMAIFFYGDDIWSL